jgi:NAD(P)H-flavin reductase
MDRIYNSRLLHRRGIGRGAFEMELEKPPGFHFQPGQFIRIFYPGTDRMSDYSMASPPSARTLLFCVRYLPEGRMSSLLSSLPPGERIEFAGPCGYFVFRPSDRRPVFVATSTGIAPFRAMILEGVKDAIILHGVRDPSEIYYQEVFKQCTSCLYVPCLSGQGSHNEVVPGAFPGRVTGYMEKSLPIGIYDFYLCGNSQMIKDATRNCGRAIRRLQGPCRAVFLRQRLRAKLHFVSWYFCVSLK